MYRATLGLNRLNTFLINSKCEQKVKHMWDHQTGNQDITSVAAVLC